MLQFSHHLALRNHENVNHKVDELQLTFMTVTFSSFWFQKMIRKLHLQDLIILAALIIFGNFLNKDSQRVFISMVDVIQQ